MMTFRLAVLIIGCAAAVLAQPVKADKDLAGTPGDLVPVIEQFTPTPQAADAGRIAGNGELTMRSPDGAARQRRVSRRMAIDGFSAAWGAAVFAPSKAP